ncbi:MAG: universal stress protein [Bacteroidales bacterium]|jgi:nucleotide-binding universal stress UspA family protein|nr:universal stress protein [Bacteroidales bacterium]
MEKDTLLVPWDFTEVADAALQHAVKIAKKLNNHIKLIHVVKSLKKGEEALEELNKDIEKLNSKYNVTLEPLVLEGSLFHVISDYASENNVSMVVMGTHGIKGMQKFTGSYALKVIVGSKIPFIVVQEPPAKKDSFKDIVFPLDYRSEAKQKLQWALFLVKYFDVKINIIIPTIKDKSLNNKLMANVHFAEKILDKYDCDYELHKIEGSNSAEESIAFAQKVDADMILIMTTKGIGITDYVLGAQEQYIIANTAKVPVMVVNPRTDLSRYGSFSATGG